MTQESKRILLDYHAPRLPAGARQLSIDSTRVAGDVSVRYSAPPTSAGSSFSSAAVVSERMPQLPEDLQAKLAHVGMRTRKSVADGYKVQGSIPSYQSTATFYGGAMGLSTIQTQQQQAARKYFSESDKFSFQSGFSAPTLVSVPRRQLKRTREESALDADAGADTDDDDDCNDASDVTLNDDHGGAPALGVGLSRGLVTPSQATLTGATCSFSGEEPVPKSLRQSSNQGFSSVSDKAKFYEAQQKQQQQNEIDGGWIPTTASKLVSSDGNFEEAPFLDKSNL
ncbi:uncharacterized protein SAPINGB_P000885 [Magnusiomyces paraingens]|uniref:Damage-regulated import facilitator 1 n=1 Tax=Magnusiomyces paraingens TaxID=2606893 RepID=A0A5E8B2T0_9ASCO|nr:uncharacterized protein SAPINGB_P000885 [Saprochaete ingens]VVT45776.1 unnamed protein product [Saprochaete ingens]